VLFAVLGVARFPELRSRSRYGVLAALLVAAVLLALPDHSTREDRHVWDIYAVRGNLWSAALGLRDAGKLEEAAYAAAAAYAAVPWLRDYSRPAGVPFGPDGYDARALAARDDEVASHSELFDRAQLLIRAGRLDEAEDLLQQLIAEGARFERAFHESSDPRTYVARIAALRGDAAGATRLLEDVLSDSPGDPFVLAELAAITSNGSYREQIERYFSPLDASYLIGTAQLELRDASGAGANFADVVSRIPEMIRTRIYLAAALAAVGDVQDAREVYLNAMHERAEPVMLEEWIVPAFERAVRDAPKDADALARYGEVLREFGRLEDALVQLTESSRIRPLPGTDSLIARVKADIERGAAARNPPNGGSR
jgi:predicted Zn-dependent protease